MFSVGVAVWLWATVLFANLAEAVAEGRGKAQAADPAARPGPRPRPDAAGDPTAREEEVPGTALVLGDLVVVEAGQVIPGDGDVVEGVATVDESAITGESAPSSASPAATGAPSPAGTTVLSDRIVVRITSEARARPSSTG